MSINVSRRLSLGTVGTILILGNFCLAQTPVALDLASNEPQQTWVPTILVPWDMYGGDFGGVAAWNVKGLSLVAQNDVNAWFAHLEQAGIRAAPWFLFADGRGGLRFDADGKVVGLSPSFLNDYQTALTLAERHNLQIIWVLLDFKIGIPLEVDHGAEVFGHADLLESSDKRRSFLRNALGPILQAGAGSKQIAGWIVINEPENLLRKGLVSEIAMRLFVREVTAAIKGQDSTQKVGIANSDVVSMIHFADIESLNFLSFHDYEKDFLPPPAKFIKEYLRTLPGLSALERPIFIGEFDLKSPPSGSLPRFLQASHRLGYSGAWPWSLHNDRRDDIAPQFDDAAAYASAMQSLNLSPGRDWILSHLQLNSGSIGQHILTVQNARSSNQREIEVNEAWQAQTQNALVKLENDLIAAKASQETSDKWAKDNPTDSKASKARNDASAWLSDVQERIRQQQGYLVEAAQQIRMHSYLAHEDDTELRWLQLLLAKAENPTELQAAAAGAL